MMRESVYDYGDDDGLRVERVASSTVVVAVVVHRNGQENGGEGSESVTPPAKTSVR
jgi:hypothetical protein